MHFLLAFLNEFLTAINSTIMKHKNSSADNNSNQNTSKRINTDKYAGSEQDHQIAKQNADQYIKDVNRSLKEPPKTNNAKNNR